MHFTKNNNEADVSAVVQALTPTALHEFEEIWRRKNPGKAVEQEQLQQEALRVLQGLMLVYRQIPAAKQSLFEL